MLVNTFVAERIETTRKRWMLKGKGKKAKSAHWNPKLTKEMVVVIDNEDGITPESTPVAGGERGQQQNHGRERGGANGTTS